MLRNAALGSGGMGDVYQATDSKLGVALRLSFCPRHSRAIPSAPAGLNGKLVFSRRCSVAAANFQRRLQEIPAIGELLTVPNFHDSNRRERRDLRCGPGEWPNPAFRSDGEISRRVESIRQDVRFEAG